MAIVAKTCIGCGEMKPLDEFHRRADSPDGRRNSCRECESERHRQYHAANRERDNERNRQHREAHREAENERRRQYREAHRETLAERQRQYYAAHREAENERARQRLADIRTQVFAHYGQACACCGTAEDLSIDHVNGGGTAHRLELFGRDSNSSEFYVWLIREGFPSGYQPLCMTCNRSKREGERCTLYHPLKYLAENGFYLR